MKIEYRRVKSKFRQCLYPYNNYHSKGPFKNKEGRLCLNVLRNKSNHNQILYARYLLEVKLKRKLKEGYEVDHIDGDCTNDTLDNLQELSARNNRIKGTSRVLSYNLKNKRRILIWCPVCGKRFKIFKWKVNLKKLKKGKKFYFCCKECAWKAQNKSFVFPEVQKFRKIKQKEFSPANQHENFKKFSKPIFIKKKIRLCDCGNKIIKRYVKYCCKECRLKFGNNINSYRVKKNKLLKYCKISLKKFGRYNYSWIGRKLNVSGNAVKNNIIKLMRL